MKGAMFLQNFKVIPVLLLIPVVIGLKCYSCQFSFNDVYDLDNRNGWCTNETLLNIAKDEVVKPCAPWEPYCITAITTTLNSFTSVSRSCAGRCSMLCESIGFGQHQVTCADCCTKDGCNSQFSVQYYQEVMQRQFMSWTKPLDGEVAFNRKHNLRFPY
uniref:Toxin_TOLIP domain-containing protein n=1 Tax=Panagrellus redivivus TaxID=6233 RepID=A0A7E4ZYH8_PANRE